MANKETLKLIQEYAKADLIVLTKHALDRSAPIYNRGRGGRRGIQYADVRNALVYSHNCRPAGPEYPDRLKVNGPDLDGDDLTLVVVIEQSVIVITII